MPDARRTFGTEVEQQVARHLQSCGYRVLAFQWKAAHAEIDLVCLDGNEVVFVEVKARQTSTYGYPEESVTPRKIQKIVRAAQIFLRTWPESTYWRIDVVAVETSPVWKITHLKQIDIPDGIC